MNIYVLLALLCIACVLIGKHRRGEECYKQFLEEQEKAIITRSNVYKTLQEDKSFEEKIINEYSRD